MIKIGNIFIFIFVLVLVKFKFIKVYSKVVQQWHNMATSPLTVIAVKKRIRILNDNFKRFTRIWSVICKINRTQIIYRPPSPLGHLLFCNVNIETREKQ